jgi:hypothetical protein
MSPDTELHYHRQRYAEREDPVHEEAELSDAQDAIEVDKSLDPSLPSTQTESDDVPVEQSSTCAPSPPRSKTWSFIKYVLYTISTAWILLAIAALAVEDGLPAIQESLFPPALPPLPYIVWSIGSNSIRCRDLLKGMDNIRNPLELYEPEYVVPFTCSCSLHYANKLS